jgi:hypothetical protein
LSSSFLVGAVNLPAAKIQHMMGIHAKDNMNFGFNNAYPFLQFLVLPLDIGLLLKQSSDMS